MSYFFDRLFLPILGFFIIAMLISIPIMVVSIVKEGNAYEAACRDNGGTPVWNGRFRECMKPEVK
jgi:hypothetical protein